MAALAPPRRGTEMQQVLVADGTAPYVFVRFVLHGGSEHDPEGRAGLSDLTASALLLGTRTMTRKTFFEALDSLGATLDISVSRDSIVVEGEVLRQHLEGWVSLVVDVLAEPAFDAREVSTLVQRSVSDLEQLPDHDESLVAFAHAQNLWRGRPLARPIGGTPTSVRALSAAHCLEFHGAGWAGEPWIAAAAGDIDEATLDSLASRFASAAGAGVAQRYPSSTESVAVARCRVIDKPNRSQAQIVWGGSMISAAHPDVMALLVGNAALGGVFTSRLMAELREERGWSYGASSRIRAERNHGSLAVRYGVDSEHAAESIALVRDLLEAWAETGLDPEEFTYCRDYLRHGFAFQLETASSRMALQLDTLLADRSPDFYRNYVGRLDALTCDEVNQALRRHVQVDRLSLTALGDGAALATAAERAGFRSPEVVSYTDVWNTVPG